MFKRLFNRLKKFFKKLFGSDGVVTNLKNKLDSYSDVFTERVDVLLKSTRAILDATNGNIDTLDDLGIDIPDNIQEAIIKASKEVGYWDDSVNNKDGFKSIALAIARRINGKKDRKQGIVFNIAVVAMVKLFPDLKRIEAELIISASIALMNKKK